MYNDSIVFGGAFMANMGRPKLEVVKDKRIALRVTQDEYDKLKEYASKNNISVSKAIYGEVKKLISKT